jgi:NAD(P)-dependent dehydrogenase (short-subunit alcohol dehydrogenase family)
LQREFHHQPDNWLEEASAKQPFGRLLDPAEVARAVAFLACDESGMMTGATINFDQSVWGVTRPIPRRRSDRLKPRTLDHGALGDPASD